MKKILLAIVMFALFAPVMSAQVRPGAPSPGTSGLDTQHSWPDFTSAADIDWANRYTILLEDQNSLLQQRKAATILTLAGGLVGGLGAVMVQNTTGAVSPGMTIMCVTGGVAAFSGSIWLLVNGFQMINNEKKINDHLILRCTPGGVALEF